MAAPQPLCIAQLVPLYESVSPKLYGGTERVVLYLTEELMRRGHDVTLFASGEREDVGQASRGLSALMSPTRGGPA